jgi:DNA polymerase III epsilon subunit-like protein
MRYAVIDLETTGFSPHEDRVVEMACVLMEDGAILRTWSTLVDPGRPIPGYATGVHGITDADVRGAPAFAMAQRYLRVICEGSIAAAHNAAFDSSFLPGLRDLRWICTLELARRCFPNAPNHKCQTLRRYLQIEPASAAALQPHRALSDALVTAGILVRCLALTSRGHQSQQPGQRYATTT